MILLEYSEIFSYITSNMYMLDIQGAMQSSGAVVDYCYDVEEELWCQFTLKVGNSNSLALSFSPLHHIYIILLVF